MIQTNTNDYLSPDEIGELDDSNYIVTEQYYLNDQSDDNYGVLYANTRFVPAEEKELYFFVENLYDWFEKYAVLDDETLNFIKNEYPYMLKDPADVTTLGKGYSYIGCFCRNSDGKIYGVSLRNIGFTFVERKFVRFFFRFCYNKNKNKLVFFRYKIGTTFKPGLKDFIKFKDFQWFTNRKTKVDPTKPIVVTEGIFDANFFDNSIALGGILPGLAIPKLYKDSELIFVLDNSINRNIYRVSKNILKMGYKLFVWPSSLIGFKDFNDYIRSIYEQNSVKFRLQLPFEYNYDIKKGLINNTNQGFRKLPIRITEGEYPNYILPSPEFIREAKSILYKLVFLDNNLLEHKDLQTFEAKYTRKQL